MSRFKNRVPGNVVPVFAYMCNTDSVEGRGQEYPGAFFEVREDAVMAGKNKGVMGTPARVEEYSAVVDRDGVLRVLMTGDHKVHAFVEDEVRENLQKKLERAGITTEELAVLGFTKAPVKASTVKTSRQDQVVAVAIEPTGCDTDSSIVRWLTEQGATEIEVLSEGYISAVGKRSLFARLGHRAVVTEKHLHQMTS